MKFEVNTTSVDKTFVYEMKGKHFVLCENKLLQLDDEIEVTLPARYIYRVCEVNNNVLFTQHNSCNVGEGDANLYFIPKFNYIVLISNKNPTSCTVIYDDNLKELYKSDTPRNTFTIDLWSKEELENNIQNLFESGQPYLRSTLNNIVTTNHGDPEIFMSKNIKPLHAFGFDVFHDNGPYCYDLKNKKRIPEIHYGTLKGYEFIRRADKFIVQTIDEDVQRINRKIAELKSIENNRVMLNTTLDKLIAIIKDLDENKQKQLLQAVESWSK